MERYLDDLQENVDDLKDRFKPEYAASAEVTTILRQGSDIQRFMGAQKPNFDGASEWNRLAASLGELATVYGTTFPMAEGQTARRLNDVELEKAADDLGKSVDHFKHELDESLKKDKAVDQATRQAALRQVDELKRSAEKLESVLDDNRPASGEAQALLRSRRESAADGSRPHAVFERADSLGIGAARPQKIALAFGLSTKPS